MYIQTPYYLNLTQICHILTTMYNHAKTLAPSQDTT